MNNSIYKYMPYRKDFLNNFLLRISQKNALNDPFEIEPSLKWWADLLLETKMYRFGNTEDEIMGFIRKQPKSSNWRHLGTDLFKRHGIISFTTRKKDILMWSHYADSHKGILVEFDNSHNFFNRQFLNQSNNAVGKLTKVIYSSQRLQSIKQNLSSPFFHKAKEWEYENEYRLLLGFGNSDTQLIECDEIDINDEFKDLKYENFNKKFKKFISRTYYEMSLNKNMMFMVTIPKGAIKSIYLGGNIKLNDKKEIVKIISENVNLQHILIYETTFDDNDYKIHYSIVS